MNTTRAFVKSANRLIGRIVNRRCPNLPGGGCIDEKGCPLDPIGWIALDANLIQEKKWKMSDYLGECGWGPVYTHTSYIMEEALPKLWGLAQVREIVRDIEVEIDSDYPKRYRNVARLLQELIVCIKQR
jgi:hypothetical protein